MDYITPILGAIGSLIAGNGDSNNADALRDAQARLANLDARAWEQYMPAILQALKAQMGGGMTTADQAAMNTALGNAQQDYTQAFRQGAAQLGARGLTPGSSSIYDTVMRNLSEAMGHEMTGIRQQASANVANRQERAMGTLGSLVSPMGNSAAATYGSLANQYDDRATNSSQAMANLFAQIGQAMARPQTMPIVINTGGTQTASSGGGKTIRMIPPSNPWHV